MCLFLFFCLCDGDHRDLHALTPSFPTLRSSDLYRGGRRYPGVAARWHEELCEGFARLEAELLSEALIAPTGNIKDATLKSRAQKYRLGLSLLAAHRAAVRGARFPAGGAAPKIGRASCRERVCQYV